MTSSSLTTRKKSSSPPIVSKQQQQDTSASSLLTSCLQQQDSSTSLHAATQDKLEDFLALFVSFILDRSRLNQRDNIESINSLLQQQHQCHIASKLREKIKKCVLDHYSNLDESNNYLLDELLTTNTTKDLQYLAKKQNTFHLFNQQFQQQDQDKKTSTLSSSNKNSFADSELIQTQFSIDIYYLPKCCHTQLIETTGDSYLDDEINLNAHLLERWVFVMLTNKKDETHHKEDEEENLLNSKSILTLSELFQAIKSYLHYSQISFWLNQSKGQQATNIAYSVNCSSEFHLDQSSIKTLTSIDTSTTSSSKKFLSVQNTNNTSNNNNNNKLIIKEFDYKSFPSIIVNHENNQQNNTNASYFTKNTYLTHTNSTCSSSSSGATKSCLNQFIQSTQTTRFKTLARVDLYSCKNQFDFTLLNNCINNCNNTKQTAAIRNYSFHSNFKMDKNCSDITTAANISGSNATIATNTNSDDSSTLLLATTTSLFSTNTSKSTTNSTHKTSNTELSRDIPQDLEIKNNINDNNTNKSNNESDLTTNESNHNLDKLLANKLKLLEKCEHDASENCNTNDNNNIINQDNNNNNCCMFNLNKFKLKATNCCSLKPVNTSTTTHNNETDSIIINHNDKKIDDDSDKRNFNKNDSSQNTSVNNELENDFINKEIDIEPVKLLMTSDDINTTTTIHPIIIQNHSIPKYITNQNKLISVNRSCNLPLSSSPAPLRKSGSNLFDFDTSLKNPRSIRNALSINILNKNGASGGDEEELDTKIEQEESSSTPSSSSYLNDLNNQLLARATAGRRFMSLNPNHLLGSFEESLLNGRMNPVGVVDGFYAVIGASGSFFPDHTTLPVNAAFYQINDDIAASPYLGIINLASLGKRGYKVPNKGTIQVTLFNPNKTVVKMFIVMYDLSDMPPGHRTFIRQRTMYVPLKPVSLDDASSKSSCSETKTTDETQAELKSYLRYLIHLRFATSKSGKFYLHTNIKLIFARDKCEIDPSLARYEYKTITEAPQKPKYSPKK